MEQGFLTNPCSCGGVNENCCKCGGWGFNDPIGEGRATPIAHGDGVPFSAVQNATAKRERRRLVKCPNCSIQVQKLTKHLRKVHGVVSQPIELPKAAIQRHLVRCDGCGSSIRADRLKSHMAKIHPALRRLLESSESVNSKVRRISLRDSGASAERLVSPSTERQLDATRDYYAAYRDHGQFGSHPSHDGFDDESAP